MKKQVFFLKSALLGSMVLPITLGLTNLRCSPETSSSAPTAIAQSMINAACSIPSDQSGTITSRWLTTPIPIALHRGDFDTVETAAITAAANTWNSFFSSSINSTTLNYGASPSSPTVSQVPNPAVSGSPCSQELLTNGQFSGDVVIYRDNSWAYSPQAMAVTTNCYMQATPYPSSFSAIMEINYQNFFIPGTQAPDLQSIVLHELGHLHGMNHSCEPNAKTGMPNCTDPSINPDYLSASMFPTFSFDSKGQGEQRRSLGVNDEKRAFCLYSGPNSGPGPSGSPSPSN